MKLRVNLNVAEIFEEKIHFFHPKIDLDAAPSAFAYLHHGIKHSPDVVFWIITAYSLIGITIRETSCVFATLVTTYLIPITIGRPQYEITPP